jgi:hypothetical protein
MQSTAQLVAAQQAEIKRLSHQVAALSAKIDALQPPAASAQAAPLSRRHHRRHRPRESGLQLPSSRRGFPSEVRRCRRRPAKRVKVAQARSIHNLSVYRLDCSAPAS